MKKWLAFIFLILCLIEFPFLRNGFLCAQSPDSGEDIEFRVWNLKQEMKIEEEAIAALKNRHRKVLKEKQRVKKIIEAEKRRIKKIERVRKIYLERSQERQKYIDVRRLREEERQLILLEQLRSREAAKKEFLRRTEQKELELEKQRQEHARKLEKEEKELQQQKFELMNQKEQGRLEAEKNKQERQKQLEQKQQQYFMVPESIKHFPIPLQKSPKVITEGDFLDAQREKAMQRALERAERKREKQQKR